MMKKVMIALLVLTVVTVEVYAQQNPGDFLDLRSVASHDSDLRFNNPLWSPDGKFIALSDENYNGLYIYNTIENTYLEITDAQQWLLIQQYVESMIFLRYWRI